MLTTFSADVLGALFQGFIIETAIISFAFRAFYVKIIAAAIIYTDHSVNACIPDSITKSFSLPTKMQLQVSWAHYTRALEKHADGSPRKQ